jgi:hypothetical protein
MPEYIDLSEYTFIGYPLKIDGSEGAQTKAVLIKESIFFF